jgi:cytochrome c oxidase cbb3-type subunit 3
MKRSCGLSLILLTVSVISSCGRESDAAQAPAAQSGRGYVDGGDSLRIIAHPENLAVGFPQAARPFVLTSPYADGDKKAIATGGQLFVAYNCIDCHGADGSGAMGPAFSDGRWHFGGAPGEVFESIYQGRPDGMPAWGGHITNDQIWMLTAYVRSLSSKDVSTENFSGKTVERTGH